MFQNSIHCWIFPSRQTYFCLYPLTNFSHSDAYLNVYNTSVSADDSERYKLHTYFLDNTSHILIIPGHYELHIVISLTFRWRLPWLVSSIPWMVSWIFTTLRMSRVCVRVCSNMPGTVRNHPCDAQCHGATSLEGKIHLTCPFLSLGIGILMIEVRLGNIKMYFLITKVFTR